MNIIMFLMKLAEAGGSTITPGTPAVFESAGTGYVSVAMLSATKAIVTYRDVNNSNYGTACILDVSGSTITPGAATVFESSATRDTSVTRLSETKAIVTYRDVNGYGVACILDVSGNTVSPGTAVTFESASTYSTSVTTLSATKAIVAYRDDGNSGYGTSCILDVSGSIITPGTAAVFESASTHFVSVTMLSATKAIVAYRDSGNSNYGTSCILDVSGSTITPGTAAIYESAGTNLISIAMLSATKAIVVYQDLGNSNYGTSCILDVSGSTITPGTPAVFESATSSYISVDMLSATKAIVVYLDEGNGNSGTGCILNVSSSTITPGTPAVFDGGSSSVATLSETKAITAYTDWGNSNYGTGCILDVS